MLSYKIHSKCYRVDFSTLCFVDRHACEKNIAHNCLILKTYQTHTLTKVLLFGASWAQKDWITIASTEGASEENLGLLTAVSWKIQQNSAQNTCCSPMFVTNGWPTPPVLFFVRFAKSNVCYKRLTHPPQYCSRNIFCAPLIKEKSTYGSFFLC